MEGGGTITASGDGVGVGVGVTGEAVPGALAGGAVDGAVPAVVADGEAGNAELPDVWGVATC